MNPKLRLNYYKGAKLPRYVLTENNYKIKKNPPPLPLTLAIHRFRLLRDNLTYTTKLRVLQHYKTYTTHDITGHAYHQTDTK